MSSIFVDTGVWYAFANNRDSLYSRADELIQGANQELVTIWPIVWETITLASRELGGRAAAAVGKEMIGEGRATIIELSSADYAMSLDVLARFDKLRLSAADAIACAVVRRLGIQEIMSFDEDFSIMLPDRIIHGKSSTN